MLKRYVIERSLPGIGKASPADLSKAAASSNKALAALGPWEKVQWDHSYITGDKTFCVYLADSEESIRRHAEMCGIPANTITEVVGMLDPTTERP